MSLGFLRNPIGPIGISVALLGAAPVFCMESGNGASSVVYQTRRGRPITITSDKSIHATCLQGVRYLISEQGDTGLLFNDPALTALALVAISSCRVDDTASKTEFIPGTDRALAALEDFIQSDTGVTDADSPGFLLANAALETFGRQCFPVGPQGVPTIASTKQNQRTALRRDDRGMPGPGAGRQTPDPDIAISGIFLRNFSEPVHGTTERGDFPSIRDLLLSRQDKRLVTSPAGEKIVSSWSDNPSEEFGSGPDRAKTTALAVIMLSAISDTFAGEQSPLFSLTPLICDWMETDSEDAARECKAFQEHDSFARIASDLVSCVSTATPGLFKSLSHELQLTVSNAMSFARSGWPSSQLVRFANQGPETNAVLVPLRNIDIHKPGPRNEWRIVYSDDEVRAGIHRNQAARILVLAYIVKSLDNSDSSSIPFSEELMTVAEIWGADVIPDLSVRGMNNCKEHREMDGLSDPSPLFKMFLASNKIDHPTRMAVEAILTTLKQPATSDSAKSQVNDGINIGWFSKRISCLSDDQELAKEKFEPDASIVQ